MFLSLLVSMCSVHFLHSINIYKWDVIQLSVRVFKRQNYEKDCRQNFALLVCTNVVVVLCVRACVCVCVCVMLNL